MDRLMLTAGAVLTTIGIYLMFEGHKSAGCGCMSAGLVLLHQKYPEGF